MDNSNGLVQPTGDGRTEIGSGNCIKQDLSGDSELFV